jgi:DNA repair exonuclease SbcCD ATPase subunit
MQAISFALFGTFSGLSSRRLALNDLIMKKPQAKEKATVELEFELNGKKYEVKRVIQLNKGTVEAEIREDGKLLEVNPQGVTNEVIRILQIDHDLFSRAIYSEQNGLDYFLRIPKGKRMDQIDSMLKLDLYERARENSVSIRNRISAKREERIRTIEDMKERNLEGRIKELENEISSKERERETFEKEIKRVIEKRKVLETSHEKEEREIENLRSKVSELNGKIMFLQNQIKEMEEKRKEREVDEKRRNELEKSLGKEPKKLLDSKVKNFEKRRKELHSLEARKDEMERGLNELEKAGNKCPVCDSKLTEMRKRELVEHKTKHIEEIREKINKLSESLEKEEFEINELKEKIEEYKMIKSSLEEIKDFPKKIESNKKEIEIRRNEVNEVAEKIRKKETKEKEIRRDLQEVIAREREIETKKSGLEEIIGDKKTRLEELSKEQELLLKYKKEAEIYERIIESMDSFTKVLRMTQDQLRDEFLKTVNYIMNRVWTELYPYGDFSGIRMVIEDDYILQLEGTRGWTNVDLVSGGERSLACLDLRIAFSLAFTPNLRWLILDEPTHNLDRNAIQHFGEVLRDRLGNFIDQIFLITHEESLSDYITGSLYRMERDKEADGVTKVIGI